jgi:erythromycin esterase-like protein
MQTVIDYLERIDPQAAEAARQRYACFEPFSGNKELYAHVTGLGLMESCEEADGLNEWRGQRAIGVVYYPEREGGNYVPTQLANRYDAYIHIDRTRVVKPLGIEPHWTVPPIEDTYPTGY